MPSVSLWAYSAEILFLYSRLSRPRRLSGQSPSICYRRPLACLKAPLGLFIAAQPQGCSKRIFTSGAVAGSFGRTAGSFFEDRPLGWDPVAEGNRAGDGMARTASEEKATRWPALSFTSSLPMQCSAVPHRTAKRRGCARPARGSSAGCGPASRGLPASDQ